MRNMISEGTIFTIGHSTHSIDRLVALLKEHGVNAVADVRSVPYSRMHPQFNRETLVKTLETYQIGYIFLGHQLGARSSDKSCYEHGRVRYDRLAKTEAFHEGIERLRVECQCHRTALMCAEREPLECHRSVLVGRELQAAGIPVLHIHADGHVESHDEAMHRLLRLLGMPQDDLFRTHDDLLEEAYRRQEAQIAYVDEDLVRQSQKATT